MAISTHPSDNYLPVNLTSALNTLNVSRRVSGDGLSDASISTDISSSGTVAKLKTEINTYQIHPWDEWQRTHVNSYIDRCKIQATGASAAILTDAEVETARAAGSANFATLRNAVADDSNDGTAQRTITRDVAL
jgi:hypothetical protein